MQRQRLLMLLGLCAIIWYSGCGSEKEEKEEVTHFLITSPAKTDTTLTDKYVCQIHSIQHIELRALEKGYLQNIFVDEGQYVKKGQLMFKILPTMYEAEFQRAQAEAKVAEIEYQNTKALADSNIVSQNELAMSQAKFEKAKAEMAIAQVHLGFTEIRAPFDGIMDRLHVRLGSLVEEGELLTSLSDNSKMWVYFNVPEPEYLNYKVKTGKGASSQVKLLMANNQEFDYPGLIETIEGEFNNETGNIAFRATFPNPDKLLRHGETGNILLPTTIKDALLIPQKATFEVLDKKYVFVLDADNVIKSRQITVGAEMPHLYAVIEGLTENDKILLEGLRQVRENDKIEVKFLDPHEVITHLELYAE
ncbi:MAG: efflux RND transporter periplasmic adaptor subunit [Bacteroidia bacterium]